MSFLNRLKWVSAALAVAGAVTSAAVWGDPARPRPTDPAVPISKLVSDDLVGRFTNKPAVTYQTQAGELYFAVQVKPELAAPAPRPRDIQILVDCSASQAGAPLDAARRVAREVLAAAGESDRVSIWTVATPKTTRNLVKGGGLKLATEAKSALAGLDAEYASGAIDLKDTLNRVAKEFDGKATRQQVILYLGDGESALNPLDEKARYALADDLHAQKIAFYAVPLGLPNNAHNLHTLVSGTGGTVLRPVDEKDVDPQAAVKALATRFHKALGVAVLEGAKGTPSAEVAELFPNKLPPLRADVPTLIVGRYAKGKAPAKFELTLEGKVAGSAATATVSHALPNASADNYFLGSMVAQWRNSGRIDAPAMLRADRTLALAFEATRLAREEFVEQADWALGSKKIDTAKELYNAALKLDPVDPRVLAGLKLVGRLEKGEVSIEQLQKALKATPAGPRIDGDLLAQDDKKDPKGPAIKADEPAKAAEPNALLKQEEARQRIREQQTNVAVEETLRRAKALLDTGDPKSAKDLLIAQRDSIRVIGDVREGTRVALLNRIEILLQSVVEKGDAIVRQRAEENERIAQANAKLRAQDQVAAREEHIRERIRSFGTLMNQARYEDAYREALVMENEALNAGYGSPGATFAVGRIGQAAANYHEFRELVRLREDRYLLSMMEVEKSHMPYPDEPAVHFPPAKIWRELTARRRTFASTDFDRTLTPRKQQKYQMFQNSLLQSLSLNESRTFIEGEVEFKELLKDLQTLISNKMRQDVPLYVNWRTWKDANAQTTLSSQRINLATLKDANDRPLPEITFKTLLELVTRQVGASFWVTPDFIEIVEMDHAKEAKVFKVLPVEDLIIPIPNAVNQLSLQQQLQVLGQQFSLAGGNAFGQGGAFGGQVGGFGGFGGGQQQGGGGGGMQNVGNIFQGAGGGQGGGGVLGFGGGNVGQFGNLGGQFGFQGGRQGTDLVTELVVLIQTVVDPGFWTPNALAGGRGAAVLLGGNAPQDPVVDDPGEENLKNRMMFNVSTRSLIIFGRSRQHRSTPGRPLVKDAMVAAPGLNPDGRAVAANTPKPAGNGTKPGGTLITTRPKPKDPIDAERIWKQAAERGLLDPGKVIACADFLVEAREFKNASELLKASLRRGITPERWYQEALAIALEESQGSADEIERARLSAIDLDPKDAPTYLSAAKFLNESGDPDGGIRLCKVAAALEPNVADPYLSALACANNPKATASYDVSAFAAGGLLNRDWALDGGSYHSQAQKHLLETVKRLVAENKKGDATKVAAMVEAQTRRDLTIELMWAGQHVDLDLRVKEPIGSICSFRQVATTGGGSLKERVYDRKEQSYVETYSAAEAFNGEYKVTVYRVHGTPQGEKAQLKVTRHKGTPNEAVEYVPVEIKAGGTDPEVTIALEAGRRKDLAALPSPMDQAKFRSKPQQSNQVMNRLRAMASGLPMSNTSMGGGVGSTNNPLTSAGMGGLENRTGDISWSTRLGSERSVGLDIRSETTIRADGKAQVRATPVFDTLAADAKVKIDLIPGGSD